MVVKNDKKCMSPWLGLLTIALVCAVIASAIFFSFKEPRRGPRQKRAVLNKGGVKVDFRYPVTGTSQYSDKHLIF